MHSAETASENVNAGCKTVECSLTSLTETICTRTEMSYKGQQVVQWEAKGYRMLDFREHREHTWHLDLDSCLVMRHRDELDLDGAYWISLPSC